MTKNTEPQSTSQKEVTFYRLVDCTPSFLEFDKNASLLKDVERAEACGEQFLIVEDN